MKQTTQPGASPGKPTGSRWLRRALWGAGVVLMGYFLGQIDFVHDHVEVILVLIVLISVVPIAVEYLRRRKHAAATD